MSHNFEKRHKGWKWQNFHFKNESSVWVIYSSLEKYFSKFFFRRFLRFSSSWGKMFSFLESRKIRFERGSNHLKLTRFSQELQNIFSNPLFLSLSLFSHFQLFNFSKFSIFVLHKISKIFVKFHFFKFHLRVKIL